MSDMPTANGDARTHDIRHLDITPPKRRPNPGETNRERFRRIAPGRMQRALEALKQVERLGSDDYEYTSLEMQKMVDALKGALHDIQHRLEFKKEPKKVFSFD